MDGLTILVQEYSVVRGDVGGEVIATAERQRPDSRLWYITLRIPGTGSTQSVEYLGNIPDDEVQPRLRDAAAHVESLWVLAELTNDG